MRVLKLLSELEKGIPLLHVTTNLYKTTTKIGQLMVIASTSNSIRISMAASLFMEIEPGAFTRYYVSS
jgi:hypothetical protein